MVKKVVIVGAGPSGILLAHYLLSRGEQYQVDLYERRSDPRIREASTQRTYSITLNERGMRALRQIAGLEACVRAVGMEMRGGVFHHRSGKTRITSRKTPFVTIDRAQLVIALLQTLSERYDKSRLNLYFNQSCTHVNFATKTVTFQPSELIHSPQLVHYDVLIGADGARSAVRSHLLNTKLFEFEQKYVPSDYKTIFLPSPKAFLDLTRLHSWRSKDGTIVLLVPQRDGSLNGAVLFSRQKNQVADLATPDAVLRFFHQQFPEVAPLIPVPEAEAFSQRSPASVLTIRCSHYHYGENVLIIGDAAHSVSPSLGQGCNAALEDAAIVNHLLDEYADDWATAIAQFTQRRKADAHALLELSNHASPASSKLFVEFMVRERLARTLHQLFPNRFAPPLFDLIVETLVPYSEILQTYQGWVAKVKKSNQQLSEAL